MLSWAQSDSLHSQELLSGACSPSQPQKGVWKARNEMWGSCWLSSAACGMFWAACEEPKEFCSSPGSSWAQMPTEMWAWEWKRCQKWEGTSSAVWKGTNSPCKHSSPLSVCWRLLRKITAARNKGLWTWGHDAVWSSEVCSFQLLCACGTTCWFYQLCKFVLDVAEQVLPFRMSTPALEHFSPCRSSLFSMIWAGCDKHPSSSVHCAVMGWVDRLVLTVLECETLIKPPGAARCCSPELLQEPQLPEEICFLKVCLIKYVCKHTIFVY